jgi:hypothetical protein
MFGFFMKIYYTRYKNRMTGELEKMQCIKYSGVPNLQFGSRKPGDFAKL